MKFLASVILFLVLLSGCAARYSKETGYYGAIACVDVNLGVFVWKCNERSIVPTIPDSQVPKEAQ